MGKKAGKNYRLWIDTGSGYAMVKGQTQHKVNRQASLQDTSSKDDGSYGTQMAGQRQVTIDFELFPDLPDAAFAALETAALADPQEAIDVQVRKNGASGADPGDVVFEASVWIGNFDTDYPKDGAVKSTFQLSLAAAPTVDALA